MPVFSCDYRTLIYLPVILLFSGCLMPSIRKTDFNKSYGIIPYIEKEGLLSREGYENYTIYKSCHNQFWNYHNIEKLIKLNLIEQSLAELKIVNSLYDFELWDAPIGIYHLMNGDLPAEEIEYIQYLAKFDIQWEEVFNDSGCYFVRGIKK